jgi:hypothetical protein
MHHPGRFNRVNRDHASSPCSSIRTCRNHRHACIPLILSDSRPLDHYPALLYKTPGSKRRVLSEIDGNRIGTPGTQFTYARRKAPVPVSVAAQRFDAAMSKPLPHEEHTLRYRVRHCGPRRGVNGAKPKRVWFQSKNEQAVQPERERNPTATRSEVDGSTTAVSEESSGSTLSTTNSVTLTSHQA